MAPTGSSELVRRWRGQTPEQRIAERRQRLLDAALEVFTMQGFHASKVRDVCRTAGLTERYFYESFNDKEVLVVALAEAIVADLVAATGPSIALVPTDLDAAIQGASRAVVTSMTDDPRRARILFVEVVGISPRIEELRRHWIGALAGVVDGAAAMVLGSWVQRSVQVQLHTRALIGAIQELLIAFARDELALDQELLIAGVANLFLHARQALESLPSASERTTS